jgi:hypothetical protein
MHRRIIAREEFNAAFLPGSRRVAPGIWIDRWGDVHFSVPELLALFALEDTVENREQVVATIEAMVQRENPSMTLIRQDPPEE